jgi:hypothetical protein
LFGSFGHLFDSLAVADAVTLKSLTGNAADETRRHCERSEAIQPFGAAEMDCFVASLLATTNPELHLVDGIFRQALNFGECFT